MYSQERSNQPALALDAADRGEDFSDRAGKASDVDGRLKRPLSEPDPKRVSFSAGNMGKVNLLGLRLGATRGGYRCTRDASLPSFNERLGFALPIANAATWLDNLCEPAKQRDTGCDV